MPRPLSRLALAATLLAGAWAAWGQQPAAAGIYTCVDAQGRRLTSDRPMLECIDREQRELNPSGTVRRTLRPPMTPTEEAAKEERERRAAEDRQRQAEERRVRRALLLRYPNQAAHDSDRAEALQAVQDAIASGHRRIVELQGQKRQLVQETEFYKSPDQWPAKLKRQLAEADDQIAAQQRFIASQDEEKKRIAARFDEELARLKTLWAQSGTGQVAR